MAAGSGQVLSGAVQGPGWVANNLFFLTPGFNTALVSKGTEPRSYQALLDPKWRGKIAWSTAPSSSGGPGLIGTVLTEMGTEGGMLYLRELSKQRIANIGSAAREVLDQVIAGEYPLALQIFNHHTVISAKKGAPVDWIKMEPVTGTLSVISVHKNAPHPNAAKLLVDFITSSEGQNIFRDAEYLPADPTVPALTPVAQARRRRVPHAFLHAGADRGQHGGLEEGLR
jgi:ABC-type Fe3+ transport system substrate-binding protein